VEDDVRHVFDDVRNRGELVQGAFDLHGRDGCTLKRSEQHAAQRVADRDAEAALERLAGELAVVLVVRLGVELNILRTDPVAPVTAHHLRYHSMLSYFVSGFALPSRIAGGNRSSQPSRGLPAFSRF